jgi:hypothetical protein
VGYDKWSYAYRDIDGSRVHESVREDGWAEGYGESHTHTSTSYVPKYFSPRDLYTCLPLSATSCHCDGVYFASSDLSSTWQAPVM